MKKLKISLISLALATGICGAVVPNIHAATAADEPTYDWVSDSDPNNTLTDATISEAQDYYGCHSTVVKCAEGTLNQGSGSPTAQIFKPN